MRAGECPPAPLPPTPLTTPVLPASDVVHVRSGASRLECDGAPLRGRGRAVQTMTAIEYLRGPGREQGVS